MPTPLADLAVRFSQEGMEALNEAIEQVHKAVDGVAEQIDEAGAAAQKSLPGVATAFDGITEALDDATVDLSRLQEVLADAMEDLDANVDGLDNFRKAVATLADPADKSLGKISGALGQIQSDIDRVTAAAKASGSAVDERLAAAARIYQKAAKEQMAPAAKAATDEIVKQVAALKGIDEAQAKALLNWEVGMGRARGGLEKLQGSLQVVGQAATIGFATATAALGGFITAGIAASSYGQIISYQMGELSRQITALFMPAIQAAVNGLMEVVQWFRSLSGVQQDAIAKWLMIGVATLGVLAILPRLVTGLGAVTGGFRLLITTLTTFLGPIGGIISILGLVAGAFMAVKASGDESGGGLGAFWASLQPIIAGIGPVISALGTMLAPVFELLGGMLKDLMGSVMALVKPLQDSLAPIMNALGAVLQAVFASLQVVAGAFSVLLEVLNPILSLIGSLVALLVNLLAPVITLIARLFTMLVQSPFARWLGEIGKLILTGLVMPFKWLADLIGQLARGIAWLTGTDKIVKMKIDKEDVPKGTGKGHRDVTPAIQGMESPEAMWNRLAQASIMATMGVKPIDEQQLEEQKKQVDEQRKTNDILRGQKLPFSGRKE